MHKLSVLLFTAVAFFIFSGSPAFSDELNEPTAGYSESSLPIQDEAEPHYLDADEAFIPELEQNEQDVSVKFTIAPEYYLYQERFTITPINCEISDIIIPEGLYHDDEYMGPSHIYYDAVTVKLKVSRTDPFPKISIRYQGCTAGMCYPPITKKIAIDRLTVDETETAGLAGAAQKSGEDTDAHNADVGNGDNIEKIPGSDFTSLIDISSDSGSIYKMMGSSILFGLVAFFCFGVLLSLTPCMFPMYPIWSSIILGSRQKEAEEICVKLFRRGKTLGARFNDFLKRIEITDSFFFKDAPLVIVVSSKSGINAGLASAYMELMAESLGLGVLYSGFFVLCAKLSGKLRSLLALPKGHKVISCIVIGYPAVKYRRIVPRKDLQAKKL